MPATDIHTLTLKQLNELALQVAGAMGPVIEQEIINLNGSLPEDYSFPSEKAIAATEEILGRFGISTDVEETEAIAGAAIDHTLCRITSDGEEYLIIESYEKAVEKIETADRDGDLFVTFRCPTQAGAVLSVFQVSSISRVNQKIASPA